MTITEIRTDTKPSAEGLLYLSGMAALNLPCELETCGDWHFTSIDWQNVKFRDSSESVFSSYGIEQNRSIPGHNGKYNVANHIRALLDLIEQGSFSLAKGMNQDYICNEKYTLEIFEKVSLLSSSKRWLEVDRFMGLEYYSEWLDFTGFKRVTPVDQPSEQFGVHGEVIEAFLRYLNANTGDYVLRGDAALHMCYGLGYFPENMKFDSVDPCPEEYVNTFCANNGFTFHVVKDARLKRRFMVYHDEADKPLVIEVSLRYKFIDPSAITMVNGIAVYKIDDLCVQQALAYADGDKTRDLFNLVLICNRYWDSLSVAAKETVAAVVEHKNMRQLDYLLKTQNELRIDESSFVDDFRKMLKKLGILPDM